MADERKRSRLPWVGLALLVLLFGYGASYLSLCEQTQDVEYPRKTGTTQMRLRSFESKAVASAFRPAGWVEAQMIRRPVGLGYLVGIPAVPDAAGPATVCELKYYPLF